MNSELRMQLQIARTGQYGDIMRTAFYALAATLAIIGFGAQGVDIPLTILIVAITLFGAIGGATALDDVSALRDDMDEATGSSTYGQHAKSRNLGLLKALSMLLIGATGLTEIAIIWMT